MMNATIAMDARPSSSSALEHALNRFAESFQRHWLAILVGILFVYSLMPFVAPLLMKVGATGLAQVIYSPYKFMCHTLGYRSFWLFGEQFTYSRGEDPASGGDFQQFSGINPTGPLGLLESRDFQGNAEMGFKTALCQRDIAIYLAMAINGIVFAMVRDRRRKIPWLVLIAIGVVPIALDGFSQLLSQPPFNLFPFRESTYYWRVLTGALFGTALAWIVFPIIQDGFFRSASAPSATPTSAQS